MINRLLRIGGEKLVNVYTVHEEPHPAADRLDRAERLVFLRDGFSWPAAVWTPLWLASRRLWVPLAIYAVAVGGGGGLLYWFGVSPAAIIYGAFAIHIVAGFEAYMIERWNFENRGFKYVGTVAGTGKLDCERRFFQTWLPEQPVIAAPAQGTSGKPSPGTLAASAGEMPRRSEAPAGAKPGPWRLFRRGTA